MSVQSVFSKPVPFSVIVGAKVYPNNLLQIPSDCGTLLEIY